MEQFLQQMTLKGLSAMTKCTWGELRGELVVHTLRLQMEYSAKQKEVFHA